MVFTEAEAPRTLLDALRTGNMSSISQSSIANITYNVQETQADGREGDTAGPSKAKVPKLEQLHDLELLSGKVYVSLKSRLSEHSEVYGGKIVNDEPIPEDEIAVKFLSVTYTEQANALIKEAMAIKKIDQKNVIRYLDAGFGHGKIKCAYLAMELCDRTSLHDHVINLKNEHKRLTRPDCMSIGKQLTSALKAVHACDIKHRDIKPSNVLFFAGKKVLKLTDFSMEKPANLRAVTAASNKRIGTDGWRAPESLERNVYGTPSDIFALGLTFYFAWGNGEHAFGRDPDLTNYNIKKNKNRNLSHIQFPDHAEQLELLKKMLAYDYRERPTASDILEKGFIRDASDELENPDGCNILVAGGPSAIEENMQGESIVVLDRRSSLMHAFIPSTQQWGHMQSVSDDIITWEMTVVLMQEYIYTLLQNQRVYRIDHRLPNAHWEQENDLLLDHGAFPSAAVLENRLYVIGGSQWGTETIKEGEVFENGEWSRIPDMNTSRKVHSVVACKGCIYSIGGWDKEEILPGEMREAASARGEKYDPETNSWSDIRRMNQIRYATAAVTMGEKIYVLGGWREGNRLTEAECYDANTDNWTILTHMNIRRSFFSAVAVDGKIYAIDGDDVAPQTIEEYDPEKDEWKVIERMASMQVWPKGAISLVLGN